MAVNVDSARPGIAPGAARIERRDAEARQDRWMSELEKQLFAAVPKKALARNQVAPVAPSLGESTRPVAPLSPWQDSAMPDSGMAAAPEQAPPSSLDALDLDIKTQANTAPAQGNTANAPAPGNRGSPPLQASSDAADKLPGLALPDGGAAPLAASVAASAGAAAPSLAHASVPGLAATTAGAQNDAALPEPLNLFSTAYAGLMSASAAAAGDADSPAAPLTAARSALSLAGASALPLGAAFTADVEAPELPEPASSGGADFAEAPEFDKRKLHVYLANDGVHAWIRDADIEAGQMRAVAQALVIEMAATGRTLSALTVNGKVIDPRPAAALSGTDEHSIFPGDSDEPAPLSAASYLPVLKGNPTA